MVVGLRAERVLQVGSAAVGAVARRRRASRVAAVAVALVGA